MSPAKFTHQPSAKEVTAVLDRTAKRADAYPKHLVCDQDLIAADRASATNGVARIAIAFLGDCATGTRGTQSRRLISLLPSTKLAEIIRLRFE